MAFFMFANWWKFTTKIPNYIITIYFKFSNKFDVGIVYMFNVGINRIIFKKLLITSNFFLWNLWSQYFANYLHFFLNFKYLLHFFPNKNCQVRKIWNQKKMFLGEGVIEQFRPKISPNQSFVLVYDSSC
jgi:hypothetical protein